MPPFFSVCINQRIILVVAQRREYQIIIAQDQAQDGT